MSRVITEGARPPIPAPHLRKDAWWALPLTVAIVLGSFIVYSTWAALQNAHYWAPPYLSPFYSPCLSAKCLHVTFGYGLPDITLPIIGILSPAFLILWGPGLFRLTCYYYRKAYYRSFWLSPPACAVPDGHKTYSGETRFPLIFQNIHRYFFYAAILVGSVLTYDAVLAWHGKDGGVGMGLGTLILAVNAVLIWAYTLGCHSCRNIIGGRLKHFSKHPVRYRAWGLVSKLNAKHQQFAWASLFSVIIADAYVMAVSAEWITDFRFFN
jgi:hypothetical protein